VVAQRKASVASKATGRLEWLGVTEGSKVSEGEIIARLENRDMQAQVDQAAASVTSARVELQDARRALERARDLERQKYVSVSALDTAQARFDKAGAGVGVALANQRAAQVGVDQTLIRAPFDGVVLTKTANVGDVITPFSSATESKGAVVTMADMETLEVEADVSEVNLGKIRIGQPCEIQLDAFPDKRMRGVVSRTVPTVDRAKATVLVKVRFVERDPAVLPEMSAKVAFLDKEVGASERQALTAVHENALATRDGQSVLFLVVDGKVRMIPVQLGQKINDLVALTVEPSVLKAGDKVVASPPDNLRDGDRVKTGLKQ
jgi:RND family efflux transporter MFP subunit